MTVRQGIPGERERDSGMKPNSFLGRSRTPRNFVTLRYRHKSIANSELEVKERRPLRCHNTDHAYHEGDDKHAAHRQSPPMSHFERVLPEVSEEKRYSEQCQQRLERSDRWRRGNPKHLAYQRPQHVEARRTE
jgi:hypothetical protein